MGIGKNKQGAKGTVDDMEIVNFEIDFRLGKKIPSSHTSLEVPVGQK